MHDLQVGSAVVRMSLGSFCVTEDNNGFSSAYDCSQLCIVYSNEDTPDEELCKEVNPCPPTKEGQERQCKNAGMF